jgi:sigma-B regulation protein RsbU (phosphoserine phosphatase)
LFIAHDYTRIAIFTLGIIFIFAVLERLMFAEALEKRRAESELQTARVMQMSLMPATDLVIDGYCISGICRPAYEVGGDYYDYLWLDDAKTKLGIAVADVTGKSMKAAITAVMSSGMVYGEVGRNDTPRLILKNINRSMYLKTDKRVFTAMTFAVIDTKSKMLTFSNAGQMMPILKREGKVRFLKVEGLRLPLGIKEEVDYDEQRIEMQSGGYGFLLH